ncbi:MAG: DUF4172 domain-containing protein, partial [Chryseolinea sp.]
WLHWFIKCLDRALTLSEGNLSGVIKKAKFWEIHQSKPLNARQRKVLNMLMDGFEGRLTSSKWAKITKSSADTALRDIQDLMSKSILVREEGGGRSTSYRVVVS